MRIFITTIGLLLLLVQSGYANKETVVQRFQIAATSSTKDTNTVELIGGYFWIQPEDGQTEVNIRATKVLPEDKVSSPFTLSWNAAQADKLYGENGKEYQVLGSGTQVNFTAYYDLKYVSPKAFQEDVIITLTQVEDPTFICKVLIARDPYRMLKVKCQDQFFSNGEQFVIDSTIMRGDTFDLNFEFGFNQALKERCTIEFFDVGILDKGGKFAMLNSKKFPRRLLTDTVGRIEATLEFKYDCWELRDTVFSLPISYYVTNPVDEKANLIPFLLWILLPILIIGFLVLFFFYWTKRARRNHLEQFIRQLDFSSPELDERIRTSLKQHVDQEREKFGNYLINYGSTEEKVDGENGTTQEDKPKEGEKEISTEEEEDGALVTQAEEVITGIRAQFLQELIEEDYAEFCDATQLNVLKDKWSNSNFNSGSDNGEDAGNGEDADTAATIGSFSDPKMYRASGRGRKKDRSMKGKGPKFQEIVNSFKQEISDYQTTIQGHRTTIGDLKDQLAQTELKAKSTEKIYKDELEGLRGDLSLTQEKLAVTQEKLDVANPYPDFITNYQHLLKDIHQFAVHHHPKLSEDALSYPLINTILYVKGQPRAVNPMFHQVTKDEYLLSILRMKETQELRNLDPQTFFDAVINGRGFSLISAVGRLYAYSRVSDPNMAVRTKLEQEQIDCEMLAVLHNQINEFLKENFQAQLLLPDLLQSHFDEVRYQKNNFSYLFKHFKVPPLEERLIYDVERVGFQSTAEGQAIIRPALVSYKISND
ncbi:MAG: hypothetical protein AAGG75_04190 [Bacteroidota bacterium]